MIPNWHAYFMNIADVIATRSPDPNTKVGSVIVDKNNRIISTGYNGAPKDFNKEKEIWTPEEKHKFVLHAENNAIIYARTDLTNCVLYVTHEPCLQCAKLICATGIKTVYYLNNRLDIEARELFNNCNVQIIKLVRENEN